VADEAAHLASLAVAGLTDSLDVLLKSSLMVLLWASKLPTISSLMSFHKAKRGAKKTLCWPVLMDRLFFLEAINWSVIIANHGEGSRTHLVRDGYRNNWLEEKLIVQGGIS
jgi:hypothetical protein